MEFLSQHMGDMIFSVPNLGVIVQDHSISHSVIVS